MRKDEVGVGVDDERGGGGGGVKFGRPACLGRADHYEDKARVWRNLGLVITS